MVNILCIDVDTFNSYMSYLSLTQPKTKRWAKHRFFDRFGTHEGFDLSVAPEQPPKWFIDWLNDKMDAFVEDSKKGWIGTTEIMEKRGWTKKMIDTFLPTPERSFEYQKNCYTKQYKIETVLAIEASETFKAVMDKLIIKRKQRTSHDN